MIKLSPSKIAVFKECPRCFWKAVNLKIDKPRGIFPSLPGGIDKVLKGYFDMHRVIGTMPREVVIPGKLFADLGTLNAWRNWRIGLKVELPEIDVQVIGALDDCLIFEDHYIPLDYKTKGSKPKDDGSQYYQTQLDIYELMLNRNHYPTCGKAYLVYVYPIEVCELTSLDNMGFVFGVQPYELKTSMDNALEIITKAAETLKGDMPEASPTCELCNYIALSEAVNNMNIIKKDNEKTIRS